MSVREPMPAMPDSERRAIEQAFDAEERATKRRRFRRQIALNIAGVLLFLALWETAPRVVPGINLQMFPPPSHVVGTLGSMIASGELWKHMLASLQRAAGGFMIGSVLGVFAGLLTGQLSVMRNLSDPVLHGLRSIPAIAFVPLAIVWFGLGEMSKVALISWGTFFPVWLNTFIGVRDVPNVLLRSAASLGCRGANVMFGVVLPAALPFILAVGKILVDGQTASRRPFLQGRVKLIAGLEDGVIKDRTHPPDGLGDAPTLIPIGHAQSNLIPVLRMICDRRCVSAPSRLPSSSGVLPEGSKPCARSFFFTSSLAMARMICALMPMVTSRGMPAGPSTAM